MKKIKNILLGSLTSLLVLSVNAASVFADGNGTYNNPYKPHKPIDTGLGDLDTIVLVGIILYAVGVLFIAYSQIMKKKLAK
jgi:hypothetical protein